ncbi:hypothetical protein NKH18_02605 [Streptomyces sp. M10(2022)]
MTLVAPLPIPGAAGSGPLLGHAIQLMHDNLGFIASLHINYGPLVEITLQPCTRTLIVQDPDLIRSVLTDLAPGLGKERFFEKTGQLLGGSVVTAAGPAGGRPQQGMRRFLTPAPSQNRHHRRIVATAVTADRARHLPRRDVVVDENGDNSPTPGKLFHYSRLMTNDGVVVDEAIRAAWDSYRVLEKRTSAEERHQAQQRVQAATDAYGREEVSRAQSSWWVC